MPIKSPSSSRQKFELNAEGLAALRAALADDPAKLKRLEERLVRNAEQAARRTALERRIAQLKSRNAALRAAAQPPAPAPPTALADVFPDSTAASVTSSTSPGNTESPRDSTHTRFASDRTTRGPSPSSPATTPTTVPHAPITAAPSAAVSVASPPPLVVDEFDEKTINKDSPPVPDTWGRQKSVFRYVGPAVKGMVSSVIPDGVLYRIVTDKGEWAFYNDTRYYVAEVRYRLLGGSSVTPGPTVTVTPVGADQELRMEVGPEETKVLLKGKVIDFENLSAAALLPKRAATATEESLLSKEPQTDWKVIAAAYPPAAGGGGRSAMDAEVLLTYCIEQHTRFVDPVFFPHHASLYRHGVDDFFVAPLHWRSPFTYLPDDENVRREVRLFRGACLDPDGLHAGHIFPDNAFLACVSGLVCHWPQQLRSVFLHPSGAVEGRRERAVGAYRVSLCRSGWWESVVVDSFLPASSTCPEFSHCANDLRLLWLPLLQKACAKLWNSYAASLNAPLESLVSLLTGGPCCTLRELWPSRDDLRANTEKATRFFAALKKVLREPSPSSSAYQTGTTYLCWLRPYSLTTARSQDTRDKLEKLYSDVGLAPGVATVVLGLETLEDGQCVVRLRQTAKTKRAAEDWLSVWRSANKSWVDSASDLVFALGNVEGTVWMALEDVPQYFQSGYLTPLTADWASVKVRGIFAGHRPSLALQLEITAPTRVLVTVTQAETDAEAGSTRGATTAIASPPFTSQHSSAAVKTDGVLAGLSCLAFAKGPDDALRFVGSNNDTFDVFDVAATTPHYTYERDVTVGMLLDPRNGPYICVPCLHVNSADVSYTMTVHAQADASVTKGGTSASANLLVRFVEVKPDATLFQSLASPTLRQTSIAPFSSPLEHQVRPLTSQRIVSGVGSSVSLAL
jgi:hypothetical protein